MVKVARRRFIFLIAAILISTMVLLPIEVAAAGTLDQQQTLITTWETLQNDAEGTWLYGQTFTAGLTGQLTEVDLPIACHGSGVAPCSAYGPVTVEIHSGSPIGALLGSSSLPYSAFPIIFIDPEPSVFIAFMFSSPSVVAGSVYAIVITTTSAPYGPPDYRIGDTGTSNPYPAGTEYQFDGTGWSDMEGYDLAFKTFVTTGPVAPVGGFVEPFNMFAVLAPWIAVIGLVGCVATVAVVVKERRA